MRMPGLSGDLGMTSLQKECLNWDLMNEWELNLRRGEGSIPEKTAYAKGMRSVEGIEV